MEQLRKQLYERLYTMPARFDDQKTLIRHLYSLDTQGATDPAIDCLANMKQWYVPAALLTLTPILESFI